MKIKLYIDVYRGQTDCFLAVSNPSHDPMPYSKRFHFVVDIPDSVVKPEQGIYTHIEDFKEVN